MQFRHKFLYGKNDKSCRYANDHFSKECGYNEEVVLGTRLWRSDDAPIFVSTRTGDYDVRTLGENEE